MKLESLKNKLLELNMTKQEVTAVVRQVGLLQSYACKSGASREYLKTLMPELNDNASDKKFCQMIENLSDEEIMGYLTKLGTLSDIVAEIGFDRELEKEPITTEERVVHDYYTESITDGKINLLFNQLLGKNNNVLFGQFILYRVQFWKNSTSPKSAKFIYFQDQTPVIIELDCCNASPNKIAEIFEQHHVFINSFVLSQLSLYLQLLLSVVQLHGDLIVKDYVYDQVGFVKEDKSHFYLSNVIGKGKDESFLVGKFTDYVNVKGNFEKYMDMLKTEVTSPRLQMALTFGVMSPINYLLHELNSDINNIVINICGMSSKGKTTVQKLATSVFAKPEIGPNGLFINPNASLLAMVRSFAGCNGMLFGIDDISRFSNSNKIDIETLIYTLESGQSKAICKSTGEVAKPTEFHGTILTSTERLLTKNTFKEGALVRINEFLLDHWTSSAQNSENICKTISYNYGLLGPKFMKYLLCNFDRDAIYQEYENCIQILDDSTKSDSQFAKRIINKLAVILVSAKFLKKYFDAETSYVFDVEGIKNLLVVLFKDMLIRFNDPKTIFRDIIDFYNKNKKYFTDLGDGEFQTYGKITKVNGELCLALTQNGKENFKRKYYLLDNAKLTALFNSDYLMSDIDHEKTNTNYSKRVNFSSKMYRCTVIKVGTLNN